MSYSTKRIISILVFLLTGLALCLGLAPDAAAADEWESFLDGVAQIQRLAEEYAGEPGEEALLLTLNYLRAERYADMEWDLVLGAADEEFAVLVDSRNPELAGLQQTQLLTLPEGRSVDAIHLIAALAGSYKQAGALCGWGGDCMQLAEQYSGQADSVDGYYALMQPAFGGAENASLFPESDLLADLDGMVLGATLQPEDDLAQHLRDYCASMTDAVRAEKFIQAQLGSANTGDRAALYEAFETALLDNDGMKLFLMLRGHADLDEDNAVVVDTDIDSGMRAAARLLADWLADALDGAVVQAPASGDGGSSDSESTPPAATPAPSPAPETTDGSPAIGWLQARLLVLLCLGGAAVLLLAALTLAIKSRHK